MALRLIVRSMAPPRAKAHLIRDTKIILEDGENSIDLSGYCSSLQFSVSDNDAAAATIKLSPQSIEVDEDILLALHAVLAQAKEGT